MFEKDIQHITDTVTLFEVTYKKDSFVIDGKEYPLGYTSYLAIQPDCRFMDTTVFAEIERFADSLTDDLSRDGLIEYRSRLITAIDSLQEISFFSLFDLEKYKEQSASSPVGQPVWALVVKAALGLVYFLLGVQALALGGDGKTRIYLLVFGLAFLAWAVIPVFVARAHKAERQAAIENKIRVEVERVENEPKTCPACGAQTKGTVCEFCGTKL